MSVKPNRFSERFKVQEKSSIESPMETQTEIKPNRFSERFGLTSEKKQQKDGFWKGVSRTIIQPALGLAKKYTYPLDLYKLAAEGEAVSELSELEERLPELMEKFPEQFKNFKGLDKEKYEEATKQAVGLIPTQGNIEKFIEEKTGIPLEAKTKAQDLLRLSGSAAAFRPGDLTAKGTAAVVAPIVKKGLQELGVPEPLAEFAGLGVSGIAPSPKSSKSIKPSGLTERRFENIKKETKVSPGRHTAIKESVEKDFRKIGEQILYKNKTYSALKDDNLFKEKIGDLFGEVENLAKEIPETIHTQSIKDAFKKRYNSRETKGISPDEFERAFTKEVKSLNESIPHKNFEAYQGVEQFRKNNKSLKELFEPGKSSAANRGKREALLEYNRSIEDVFKKKYPDSEFNKLFEFTNKRWQEISDIEKIEGFVDDVFSGKIDYGKAKKVLNKSSEEIQRPLKRILGDEGVKDFKQLTEDLLSTEKSMGYIKKAEQAGFGELAKTASIYLVSKKAGTIRSLSKASKQLYQTLLDKPKLNVTWRKAFDNLKEGNYSESQKYFTILDKEMSTKRSHQKNQEEHQ